MLLKNNINNDNGVTVLMCAAKPEKAEVFKLLLRYNPNLELQNLDDYRAIDSASNIEILVILKNV
ncbi:MAG: hypothetical protein AAF208_02240 [Cyanobacteria bacterium P01_A01_bin.45]